MTGHNELLDQKHPQDENDWIGHTGVVLSGIIDRTVPGPIGDALSFSTELTLAIAEQGSDGNVTIQDLVAAGAGIAAGGITGLGVTALTGQPVAGLFFGGLAGELVEETVDGYDPETFGEPVVYEFNLDGSLKVKRIDTWGAGRINGEPAQNVRVRETDYDEHGNIVGRDVYRTQISGTKSEIDETLASIVEYAGYDAATAARMLLLGVGTPDPYGNDPRGENNPNNRNKPAPKTIDKRRSDDDDLSPLEKLAIQSAQNKAGASQKGASPANGTPNPSGGDPRGEDNQINHYNKPPQVPSKPSSSTYHSLDHYNNIGKGGLVTGLPKRARS